MRTDLRKLLIIILSVVGLGAIVTVITMILVNASTDCGWGTIIPIPIINYLSTYLSNDAPEHILSRSIFLI